MKTILKITDSAEKAQRRLAARLLSKRELTTVLNICEHTIKKWVAGPRLRLSNRLTPCNPFRVEAALARCEVKVGARR